MHSPAAHLMVVVAAATDSQAPLRGHLWHSIEAIGFLVFSLGGVAVAEFVQARRRRDAPPEVGRGPAGSSAGPLLAPRQSSAVAVLPARVVAPVSDDPPASLRRATLLPLVALAGAAAAAVHVVVMPDHFEESALYGTFFAVAALVQLGYSALLLARPSRSLLVAGALGNAAIVGLWLVTRTIGIPLGPAAGTTETFGGLDVLASSFELLTAVGAAAVITRGRGPLHAARPSTWTPPVWVAAAIAATAIGFTAAVSPPS